MHGACNGVSIKKSTLVDSMTYYYTIFKTPSKGVYLSYVDNSFHLKKLCKDTLIILIVTTFSCRSV